MDKLVFVSLGKLTDTSINIQVNFLNLFHICKHLNNVNDLIVLAENKVSYATFSI